MDIAEIFDALPRDLIEQLEHELDCCVVPSASTPEDVYAAAELAVRKIKAGNVLSDEEVRLLDKVAEAVVKKIYG